MPKKKPVEKKKPSNEEQKVRSYHEFRALQWKTQPTEKVDFRASALKDGSPLDQPYLSPKPILFYADLWLCPDHDTARNVARHVLGFSDVNKLTYDQRYVYVYWNHKGQDFLLPGQSDGKGKTIVTG